MPTGQVTSILGRQILADMGQTTFRTAYVNFPPTPELPTKKYGIIMIERLLSTGEFIAVENKILWRGGVGWMFLANHMVVSSPSRLRLVADMYVGGLQLRWSWFQ